MKPQTVFIFLLTIQFTGACKKESAQQSPLASLTITNAVVGTSEIKLGSDVLGVFFDWSWQYSLLAGSNNLYIWPVEDSLDPVYTKSVEVKEGGVYSLFLAGELGGSIDPVWLEEFFPIHTGHTTGIRFIHLASLAPHLSIKFVGETEHQFSDLEYKEKTDFKIYPVEPETFYEFEIVDNTTGDVLTTYSVTPRMFKNVTLAITGVATGDPAISVIQVNH